MFHFYFELLLLVITTLQMKEDCRGFSQIHILPISGLMCFFKVAITLGWTLSMVVSLNKSFGGITKTELSIISNI